VSVLKGEGKVPILFGSISIPAGSVIHRGYLARPDLTGEWPTVVLVPSAWGVTSSAKDLARRLARQGMAVVAPDLYRGHPPPRGAPREQAVAAARALPAGRALADLEDIVDFISDPGGSWSNAAAGFGVAGFGEGGRHVAALGARHGGTPVALVGARLRAPDPGGIAAGPYPLDVIEDLAGPLLGLSGRVDEAAPIDDVMELRRRAPHAEWVLYEGAGADFYDDYLEGYDAAAHKDALERLTAFFEKHLQVLIPQ
jgi:carboxymethylenebutenolidase